MLDHSRAVSKTSALRREIQRKFHEVGIGGTLTLGACKLINQIWNLKSIKNQNMHPFDLKYGTDTSGIIKPGALDIPDHMVEHAVQYQSAIVEVFLDTMESISISYEEFLFIDLGSGKGRALLLASHYPFKEIIGVELSASLHNIACNNIGIYRDAMQKCHRIQSVCEDASYYKIPLEKIFFYLFNPFDEHILRTVYDRIEESLKVYPRDIYITYLNPIHRNIFDRSEFFTVVKDTEKYAIYSSNTLIP